MKHLKFLGLMLLALVSMCLVACGEKFTEDELKGASSFVHAKYKDGAEITTANYELVASAPVGSVIVPVKWSVEVTAGNKDDVKVVKGDDVYIVEVNSKPEEEVKYNLIATIGSKKTNVKRVYEKSIPAFKTTSWSDYANAEADAVVNVSGVITAFGGSANSVTVYFETAEGAYYGYGLKASEETFAALEVGKTIFVSGKKDTYKGTYEVVDGEIELLEDAKVEVAPTDMTEVFKAASGASDETITKNQGRYVTIKGVELESVDGKYYYFTIGNVRMYVYASTSSVFVNSDGMAELAGKVVKGQVADITGVIGMYNKDAQIIPLNTDAIKHVSVTYTDQEILEKAKEQINELANKTYSSDLELFTETAQGAKITWTSANTDLIANDGKLGNYPLENTEVELTADITAGALNEKVTIKVTVEALKKITIAEANKKCDENNVTIWIEGQIIGFDKSGYFFLGDETGTIYVRTVAEGLAVGDSVKVIGNATQYTSKQYTRQIGNATITKLDTKVELSKPVKIEIADLGTPATNEEVMACRFYGQLVTVTGYVTIRGSYSNVHIAVANDTESASVQYWYSLPAEEIDKVEALQGKLVTITAPIYNWSSSNGWALGSALEIVEGEKELGTAEGAQTIEAVYGLEKDAAVLVQATVKFVNDGTGLIVTDGTNNLFVYTKADLSGIKVGDVVLVEGKKGTYNLAPQVTGSPVVTLLSTGKYEAKPEEKTLAEVNALDFTDPKNFGKEFTVTGTPVVSGNYVNFKAGDVTYSLYLSAADKEVLKAYADKEITITVLTYNYYEKNSIINLFADVTTIVAK